MAFAQRYAPDAAAGVIDFQGFAMFRGPQLEELNAEGREVPSSVRQSVRDSGALFSDLNQWMLKVLLAPELPEPLLSGPRGQYRNARFAVQKTCFGRADRMTYRRRSELCTARVISARRKASFSVGPCRTVSLDLADESRETADRWTYSFRLSRRRSRVRVPSTPPMLSTDGPCAASRGGADPRVPASARASGTASSCPTRSRGGWNTATSGRWAFP